VPDLAAELVRLKVDLIFAPTPLAALAAQKATSTIPIVTSFGSDPVQLGLVASLGRPGGNITGLTSMSDELSAKQLELLKETVPRVSRVAVLWNRAHAGYTLALRSVQGAAQTLRVQLQIRETRPDEFDTAFAAMTKERAGALLVLPGPVFFHHRTRLADLAAKHRLPAMFWSREFVEAGGLMAYGASLADLSRRAATYVDKILKGAKPADLPVEQASKFEFVINLKTAKALGLTIPQSILIRADEVIQ
jgi:putative ABC transport system substrate-binding protein